MCNVPQNVTNIIVTLKMVTKTHENIVGKNNTYQIDFFGWIFYLPLIDINNIK